MALGTVKHHQNYLTVLPSPVSTLSWSKSLLHIYNQNKSQLNELGGLQKSLSWNFVDRIVMRRKRIELSIVASSGNNVATPFWDGWKPAKSSKAPPLSDVVWPAAGAFVAMALLGKMDQILAPRGISLTIPPIGAVCAVLFATPTAPAARKYNVFLAQIGCAAIGVLTFSILGPGWLARSTALAAAIAFMIYTGALHPPAASLPLLFIDGVKLQDLKFWYAIFPGAAGCILLCLIQEIVCYLKENFRF